MAEEAFSEYTFEELEISSSIKRAVRELGFEKMTPIQAQAIPVLLEGRDVIGQAQTGTGKTAAFGIPVLQMIDPHNKKLQAVILCPTRELAMQAANELRNFAKYMHDVKVLPVYGGQDIARQIRGLKGVQIIVGTPGRVMDHMRRHTIKMDAVKMVVLDEADEMLNMGFREDMEVILGAIEQDHQTCLFSATMPQPILDLTDQYQKEPQLIKITREELTLNTIKQFYYPVKSEYKNLALLRLLAYYRYKKSVIFCNTKSMVDDMAVMLQQEGYAAEGLHGDLTQKQRDSVMGRFRSGSLNILIATDIAARGIDVDDVEAVFNYDIPQETEYYVHRIGRTGRAGREGVSHTLCRSREFRRIHAIEEACNAVMIEKRIPTPAEIRSAKQTEVLDSVLKEYEDGHSGYLIPVVRQFCQEKGISAEEFAAAAMKKELGEMVQPDETVIDLPTREEKQKEKAERPRRGFGAGIRERFDSEREKHRRRDSREERDERRNGRGRDHRDEEAPRRGFGKGRDEEKGKREFRRRDEETGRKGSRRRPSDEMTLSRHELKVKNKERSKRELSKAIKDVRMSGAPKEKYSRKR